MAIPILNHLDLRSVSELQNAILHKTTRGNASHAAGKIIYDTGTVYVSNGSAWFDLSGDIKQVKVTDDGGVAYDVTNGNFDLVISGDTGITTAFVRSGDPLALTTPYTLKIDLDDTSTDMTATNSGVYGSATAIPIITVDRQGRLTNATTASVATALTVDADSTSEDVDLLTDDLQIIGTSNEIETAVTKPSNPGTNVKVQIGLPNNVTIGNNLTVTTDLSVDGVSNLDNTDIDGTLVVDGSNISLDSTSTLNIDNSNTTNGITIGTATADVPVTIGNASSEVTIGDNLTVEGDFTVKGTQTTLNETVKVVENNTIEFEGTTDDTNEIKLTGGDPTAARVVSLPDASGTIALTTDITARQFSTTIGNNSATTINLKKHGVTVTGADKNLPASIGNDSTKFMIQLIEVDTGLTAMADVVRGADGLVTITFAQKPDTDKIIVLINKIG
jgi:hypothetical protein